MWLSRFYAFLRGAWRTLPVETLAVALAAAGAIGVVHGERWVWCFRLLCAGVLLTPLAFAAHRLGRRTQLIAGVLAAIGVIAALAEGLPEVGTLSAPTFTWPFRLALLAALLVPFVASGRRFTRFVRRFFEETTTWGLLWLGAMAALAVVFTALRALFDLRVEDLGADAAIALTAGFILVYLHRLLDGDQATPGRMPELWRRLATTIGAPFVSVMLAILVGYELVSLVRGELPRNMLSPLIMAAGFVGFVSTLIISSVLGEDTGAALQPAEPYHWARRRSIRLARAFPVVLIALLPMAVWALWGRVEQYGVTPFRAVRAMGLLCLASLSLVGTVRWLRGRAPLSWEVPGAILLFALAAAFGPTSAVRLSIASQTKLLRRWLDEVGAGRTVGTTTAVRRFEVEPERHRELQDALQMVAQLGGEPALRGLLSGSVEACADRWSADDCLHRLGIYPRGEAARPEAATAWFDVQSRFVIGAGELSFVELSRDAGAGDADRTMSSGAFALLRDGVAVFAADKEAGRASLAELIAAAQGTRVLPARMVPVVGDGGIPVAELAVQRLEVWQVEGATPEVLRITGVVVWRRQPGSELEAPAFPDDGAL
jgi:hypothetical protein